MIAPYVIVLSIGVLKIKIMGTKNEGQKLSEENFKNGHFLYKKV